MFNCYIYKSSKKNDTYLYISEKDNFELLEESMLTLLGQLKFVMHIDLEVTSHLAHADIEQVKNQLREEHYYLQLPPSVKIEL